MYTALLLLVCSALVSGQTWEEYKLKYGKTYSASEDHVRYAIWQKNSAEIEAHNADYTEGYEREANMFSDMTDEEFKAQYCGCLKIPEEKLNGSVVSQGEDFVPPPASAVAEEMDWRTKGYVTAVKNQGQCGSCYSFSATGSLEGAWFKKTGKLVSFSEQQIVDCSFSWIGNKGCMGGWYQWAWQYLKKAGGSETEADYPYKARKLDCTFNKAKVVAPVKGYHDLRKGDENQLKEALATVGPVSVAIDAGRPGFRSYKSGVYYDWWCSTWKLNHAVLAVGYGTENGQDYWLVKNSWSPGWGDQGYIKMARNRGNACGIATYASYPLV